MLKISILTHLTGNHKRKGNWLSVFVFYIIINSMGTFCLARKAQVWECEIKCELLPLYIDWIDCWFPRSWQVRICSQNFKNIACWFISPRTYSFTFSYSLGNYFYLRLALRNGWCLNMVWCEIGHSKSAQSPSTTMYLKFILTNEICTEKMFCKSTQV